MYYFAYGLNLSDERNRGWQFVRLHRLNNFRWIINERGVATMVNEKGSYVWGAIFKITDYDLAKLDKFEGFPKWYNRNSFEAHVEDIDSKVTYYYDVANTSEHSVSRLGYIESILSGMDTLHFPAEWKDKINSHQ